MFIAEAPGRLGADRTGVPLHGDKTGDNFEQLLGNVGWKRNDIFITNAVLCNPREENGNNGTPTLEELVNCSAFLEMTIELIQPEVVVSLGAVALKALGLIAPHGLTLKAKTAKPAPWTGRVLVPLYHPGPRALIHRSLAKQRADLMTLVKLADPTKGLVKKRSQRAHRDSGLAKTGFTPIHHLIHAIVQELGRTTYFKLTKLLYMADLLALKNLGHTLTDSIYLRQVEGPWNPALKKVLPALSGHEVIFHFERRIPLVERGPNPRFIPEINGDALSVLAEILSKYRDSTNSQMKVAAYRTEPMRYILSEEKKGRDMRRIPIIYKDKTVIQIDSHTRT